MCDDFYKDFDDPDKTRDHFNQVPKDGYNINELMRLATSHSLEEQLFGYSKLKDLSKQENFINTEMLRTLYINIPTEKSERYRFFNFLAFLSSRKAFIHYFDENICDIIISELKSDPLGTVFKELLKIIMNLFKYKKEEAKIFLEENFLFSIIERKIEEFFGHEIKASIEEDKNQKSTLNKTLPSEKVYESFTISAIFSFLSNIPLYLSPDEVSFDLYNLLLLMASCCLCSKEYEERLKIDAMKSLSQIIYSTDGSGCEIFATEEIIQKLIQLSTSKRLNVSFNALLCLRNFCTLEDNVIQTIISFGLFSLSFQNIPSIDLYDLQREQKEKENQRILRETFISQGITDEETLNQLLGNSSRTVKTKLTENSAKKQFMLLLHNVSLCKEKDVIESLLQSNWMPQTFEYLDETGLIFMQEETCFSLSAIITNFNDLTFKIQQLYPSFIDLSINVFDSISNEENKTTILNAIFIVSQICMRNSSGEIESSLLESIHNDEFLSIIQEIAENEISDDPEIIKQIEISHKILSLFNEDE